MGEKKKEEIEFTEKRLLYQDKDGDGDRKDATLTPRRQQVTSSEQRFPPLPDDDDGAGDDESELPPVPLRKDAAEYLQSRRPHKNTAERGKLFRVLSDVNAQGYHSDDDGSHKLVKKPADRRSHAQDDITQLASREEFAELRQEAVHLDDDDVPNLVDPTSFASQPPPLSRVPSHSTPVIVITNAESDDTNVEKPADGDDIQLSVDSLLAGLQSASMGNVVEEEDDDDDDNLVAPPPSLQRQVSSDTSVQVDFSLLPPPPGNDVVAEAVDLSLQPPSGDDTDDTNETVIVVASPMQSQPPVDDNIIPHVIVESSSQQQPVPEKVVIEDLDDDDEEEEEPAIVIRASSSPSANNDLQVIPYTGSPFVPPPNQDDSFLTISHVRINVPPANPRSLLDGSHNDPYLTRMLRNIAEQSSASQKKPDEDNPSS